MFISNRVADRSPESIRARIVERLQRELPGHELKTRKGEPFRLTLFHPEAGELVLNLGNLVHEVRDSSPRAAEQIIEAFVSMAKQALNPPHICLKSVFPALRHHGFLQEADVSTCDPLIGEGPGDLISVVLADLGEGLATVTEQAAIRAGLMPDQILRAAEQNFVKLLPQELYSIQHRDGVVSVGLDSLPWLGTSLLFVPSIVEQVMMHFGWTRVLVGAPGRETVDLVDAAREDAVAAMEGRMARQLAGARPQSEFVLSLGLGDTFFTTTHRMSGQRLYGLN